MCRLYKVARYRNPPTAERGGLDGHAVRSLALVAARPDEGDKLWMRRRGG